MRSKLVVLAVVAGLSAAAFAAQADDVIKPASVRFAAEGHAALGRGQANAAYDSFETAVAIDPKNREAFIGMARASQALGFPGKAVKFYREALQIEPNDLTALEGQGEALIQRGAKARAQANLDRIRQLCKSDCAPATKLAALIAKAPATTAVATAESKPVAKN